MINFADSPWQFQNCTGKVAPERRRVDRYATFSFSTPATSLILLDSRMPAPSLSEIRPRSNFQWAGRDRVKPLFWVMKTRACRGDTL